jgi:hypothetical protein
MYGKQRGPPYPTVALLAFTAAPGCWCLRSTEKYHAQEVDRYSRVGIQRIQRVEWVEIFQRIGAKALTVENI